MKKALLSLAWVYFYLSFSLLITWRLLTQIALTKGQNKVKPVVLSFSVSFVSPSFLLDRRYIGELCRRKYRQSDKRSPCRVVYWGFDFAHRVRRSTWNHVTSFRSNCPPPVGWAFFHFSGGHDNFEWIRCPKTPWRNINWFWQLRFFKSFWFQWKSMKCQSFSPKNNLNDTTQFSEDIMEIYMSHFSYMCKTKGENEISHLISALCVNRLSVIPEYSRFIDYSIIWMSMWCGLPQKLHKIEL